MAERTRRLSLSLRSSLLDHLAEAAAGRGLSLAAFVRQACIAALEADYHTPEKKLGRGKKLTAQDVLKLDASLKRLGFDMAQAVKD